MPTIIHKVGQNRTSAAELQSWAGVPVTILSDVTSGRLIADPRIRPLRPFPLGKRMIGPAVTAWCERADFGPVLHAIDIAVQGDVIVNGAVRDIDTIASWADFPVCCLGNTARGPLSKERGTVNDAIVFGGIPARPGDIVLGDNDGLAIIPAESAEAVLAHAQERVRAEERWAAELSSGRKLVDVFSVPEAL
jgi:regulator of RNase E activity RraA